MSKDTIIIAIAAALSIAAADRVEANLLAHATKGAAARSIFRSGFKRSAMRPNARFGKGVYLSNSAKTAIKERPAAQSVALFKKSKPFNKRVMDTRGMSSKQLKAASGLHDMRGSVKRGVIGPKLGHRLGTSASRNGNIIEYSSARSRKGANYFVPGSLYSKNNRLIKPVRIIDGR